MRNFSEKEIEKYIKYFDENMIDILLYWRWASEPLTIPKLVEWSA